MDSETLANAEQQIAHVQAALDEAQKVIQAAERAQEAAERSAEVMRTVALAAVGGIVVLSVVHALRRHH